MIEGLEILIARMDTNPDEFINGEWDYFLEDHPLNSEIFTEEELQSISQLQTDYQQNIYILGQIDLEKTDLQQQLEVICTRQDLELKKTIHKFLSMITTLQVRLLTLTQAA